MNITFEERQLMSLYNTGTRTGLIAALEEMRGYLAADETELRELTDSAIAIPTHGVLTATAIWPSTAIPVWSICFSVRPAKPTRRSSRKPLSGIC